MKRLLTAIGLSIGVATTAQAGPFILDLTDADDHGFFDASSDENVDGWFYMQRVLENLSGGVTNGSKTVVQLGADPSSSAFQAAQSAFQESTLASSGWNWVNVNGEAALTAFFDGTGSVNINNAGIIQMDSDGNVSGGSDFIEQNVFNLFATTIDSFLGGGGALHSMAQDYGWLSTLLPNLTLTTSGGTGLELTAAGQAAFPGLTDSDLSAGPFHGHWTGGFGGLSVLFIDPDGDRLPVGIGAAGGSVTDPGTGTVPAPATILLLGLGLLSLGWMRQRQ